MTDCLFLQKHQQWCNKKHRDRCEETEGTAAGTAACGSAASSIFRDAGSKVERISEYSIPVAVINDKHCLTIEFHSLYALEITVNEQNRHSEKKLRGIFISFILTKDQVHVNSILKSGPVQANFL